MNIILLERIEKLGAIGDVVSVKDGYARNFLLPQKKALRANEANRKVFEANRERLEQDNAQRRDAAAAQGSKVAGETVVLIRSASNSGQLYGSVSARDVADLIASEGHEINKNHVVLNTPIKTIGFHTIPLHLHGDVNATVTINIARTKEEAERQAAGEKLDTADAIYGANEDAVVPGGMEHFGDGDEM